MEIVAEVWRDVKGYEGVYQVSNAGNVRSMPRECVSAAGVRHVTHGGILERSRSATQKQYRQVVLFKNGKRLAAMVHRLVAEAFVERPAGKYEVNHINGIKADNRAGNLEWVTRKENIQHAVTTGLSPRGEDHLWSKLTADDVREIRRCQAAGEGVRKLARRFGVGKSTVQHIVNYRTWKMTT